MPYKAIDIANWFISKSAEFGDLITHLKVQKLLYYAEAWTQVLLNRELFNEQIQAWSHGPVVPEVFQHFKEYGWNPLPIPEHSILSIFEPDIIDVLEQVFDTYADFSARKLEVMTHADIPWIEARGQCSAEERCTNIIPKSKLKYYFAEKYGQKENTNPAN